MTYTVHVEDIIHNNMEFPFLSPSCLCPSLLSENRVTVGA